MVDDNSRSPRGRGVFHGSRRPQRSGSPGEEPGRWGSPIARLGLLLAASLGLLIFVLSLFPEMRLPLLVAFGVGACAGVSWRLFGPSRES